MLREKGDEADWQTHELCSDLLISIRCGGECQEGHPLLQRALHNGISCFEAFEATKL